MKWWLVGGVLGLGLTVWTSGTAREAPSDKQVEPQWLTDYSTAKAAARRSGQPLLVVFR